MEINSIKEKLQNNLKEIDEKIKNLSLEIQMCQEFKFKLLGGLEVVELLENGNKTSDEINLEEYNA